MLILFIIESPGKIAKISSILGKNYKIVATLGHFRELDPKSMSIDFDHNFEPIYVIIRPEIVRKLKTAVKNVDMIYLATDPDREGAAIAQSVYDVLPNKYKQVKRVKRVLYHAITKQAIMEGIANAGEIDKNLVNAQKARRVIDRLFGYMISPILQKKLGRGLSAGRVQSATLRLVVDKDNEINDFLNKTQNTSFFKVYGDFSNINAILYESKDINQFNNNEQYIGDIAYIPFDQSNVKVIAFMKRCLKSEFIVHSITDEIVFRSPAPPFTTSTLQQEANSILKISIDDTMRVAQKLYEEGYITYMRTDSVKLSPEVHREIKRAIENKYGKEYYKKRIYKTKVANAAEAHEAIRPTHINLESLEGKISDLRQIRLYDLIWKRTIASQMESARINVTTIQITISKYLKKKIKPYYYFQSQIENVIFPGFMKVYSENINKKNQNIKIIPKVNDVLTMNKIIAQQEYLKPPLRYTQASLVKKMEEIGIGRPSTYVNTIKTIMNRKYVKIGDIPGIKKDILIYTIKSENGKHDMKIYEEIDEIQLGKENKKIIPTDLGREVNEFLLKNFSEMVDYKFTAKMEKELDDISNGRKVWNSVVENFYNKLKPIVDEISKMKSINEQTERFLGRDENGNDIFAVQTRYGPRIKKKIGSKTFYVKVDKPLYNVKLSDALKIFKYSKYLGKYNNKDVYLQKGQYGFYLSYNKNNYPISKKNAKSLNFKEAVKIIKNNLSQKINEFVIKDAFGKRTKAYVIQGKYGKYMPYIQIVKGKSKINYSIPKNIDPKNITKDKINKIIMGRKIIKRKNKRKQK